MIDHLRGREKALEAFGWTGRRAEWIALACLHGGVFTRAQWTSFLGCHHEHVRRAVHALVAQGAAIEENPPGIAGIGRVCRIHRRGIYRALGAGDRRRRRITSREVLMRRLLAFDYVLDHPQLPWLPTEPEKMAAFEALSVERRLLPRRVYRGAAGNLRRYFPPLGCRAPRTLGAALGSRPRDRSRGRRPDNGRAGPGGDGARQLGARSPPLRIRPRNRPRDRPDRPGHHQG